MDVGQNHREVFTNLLDDFYSKLVKEIDEIPTEDDNNLRFLEAEYQKLRLELSNLEDTLTKTRESIESTEAECEKCKTTLEKLSAKEFNLNKDAKSLTEEIAILKSEKAAKENQLRGLEKESEVRQNAFKENINETQTAISNVSKYLGLDVRVLKDNRLQFLFKNFSEGSQDEIAYVVLRLEDHTYKVLETYPELDEIEKMEKLLNSSNNLAGFIQHCREEFNIRLAAL